MTELEVIAAVAGGLAVLAAVLGYAAVALGYVEGTLTLRIVPRRKRAVEAAASTAAGEVVPLQDRGEAA